MQQKQKKQSTKKTGGQTTAKTDETAQQKTAAAAKTTSAPAQTGRNSSKSKTTERTASAKSRQKQTTSAKTGQQKTKSAAQQKTKSTTQQKTKNSAQQSGSARKSGSTTAKAKSQQNARSSRKKAEMPVRITFIGGLNEIGKNVTMYECGDDAILVDCGMAFPDDQMLGIDLVIPDFTYVEQNAHKIRGIFLTHAHEDHIGSLPYLLKRCNIPLYGTKLTLGLVEGKLREHGIFGQTKRNVVTPGNTVQVAGIGVEFISVNHSIPDAVAFAIHTQAGTIVHMGDFKIDTTPVYGEMMDIGRFAQLGKEGVLCMLSDSTNAERAGFTMSERSVGASFDTLFQSAAASSRRIIIATFASNIQRIQQIIDCAAKHGRKVAVSGRSMINAVAISQELGYLNVPAGTMIDLSMINRYKKEQIVLITTGSQGEPMSALSRMAFGDHRQLAVDSDDFIIISATPIPGNEKTVSNVVNELLRHGCEVVYEKMYDVHVSGHACQEELKLMIGLVKPRYFIPVHGEQKHLKKHAGLAEAVGVPKDNVMIVELGDRVELTQSSMKKLEKVQSGRVLVDGYGVGDVGSVVLRDRKHLGEDGLIIIVAAIDTAAGSVISGPDVVSRGFVYVRDAEPLIDEVRSVVRDILDDCTGRRIRDWGTIKNRIRDEVSKYLYERTKRSPMILPILMEV